ncbi:transposase [Leuconostoc sp. MS02]|uniref:Transposase n=1 Tax=Leuconostoc aquikimchii TaxID=3236804 RepID=A0ABV3S550_9LACO
MTKYSFEQKVTVVAAYFSGTLTQKELAQHYHMTPRLVSKWVNQVRTTGYDALKIKNKQRYFDAQAKFAILNYKTTHHMS